MFRGDIPISCGLSTNVSWDVQSLSPKSFFSWSTQISNEFSQHLSHGQRQVPIFTGELKLYWSTHVNSHIFYGNSELFKGLPASFVLGSRFNFPWVHCYWPQFFDRSKGSSEEAPVKVAPWQWLGKPSLFDVHILMGGPIKCREYDAISSKPLKLIA